MLLPVIKTLFIRDFDKLHYQISSFKNIENLWRVDEGISNSAGNLALHILGNTKTYIGAGLGNTGYIRDRHAEFHNKNVPVEHMLSDILETKDMVVRVLDSLQETDLDMVYPIDVFKEPMTTKYFLVHLTSHLAYHLGQINYYRRLFDH